MRTTVRISNSTRPTAAFLRPLRTAAERPHRQAAFREWFAHSVTGTATVVRCTQAGRTSIRTALFIFAGCTRQNRTSNISTATPAGSCSDLANNQESEVKAEEAAGNGGLLRFQSELRAVFAITRHFEKFASF